MTSARGSSRGPAAQRALAALLGVSCVLSTLVVLTAPPAAADPGHPGEPAAPIELFHEDFEATAELPVMLDAYVRADGGGYTADPVWLSAAACNGILTNASAPDMAGCSTANNNQIRGLASTLGTHNGTGAANTVVSAYTAGDPGANAVQLRTVEPLEITVEDRFLAFSVSAAATNCGVSAPLFQFFLDDGTDLLPATSAPIDPCLSGGVGTFTSDQGILFTGTDLGIVMTNANGSGNGNDAAFDDIRILDVTPQLDKAFLADGLRPGGIATITFTVTNTAELGAKEGWSFTEQLPAGLTIAPDPAFESLCATITAGGVAGASSVSVTGSLEAGAEACTIAIDVQVGADVLPGTTITNVGSGEGANVVDLVGLDAPGDAAIGIPTTIDPRSCVATDVEYALVTFNPPVAGEVVDGGGPGTWARYGAVAVVDGTVVDMVATVLSGSITSEGFRSLGQEARWNLPSGAATDLRFAFYEAGTDTPFPLSAAFVTSDLDSGERATFAAGDLASYTLPLESWVTVAESAGAITFTGGGTANFDPRASFQTILEGVSSYESTWSGGSNSGFQLTGNGSLVFPPQCWNAEKTVISDSNAAPGATITYQVTLTNTGEVDLTGLTMVDDLAGVLADATWVGDHAATTGALVDDPEGETLTWTGDLPLGAPVTITYSVVIADDAVPGETELVNTITGPTNCPDAACTTSTPIVDPVSLFFDCSALVTFDEDSAGWRVATVYRGLNPVIGPLPADWSGDGGNPGGAVVSDDLDANWTEIWTPELRRNGYATDYSGAIGEALWFDYRNDTGVDYDIYVAVESADGDRLYYVFAPQIVDSTTWNQIVVPLDAEAWLTGFGDSGPTGEAPTAEQFAAVLADVDHFAFSVEGRHGEDRTWFDNFGVACLEPGLAIEKGYEHDDADGDGELTVGEAITYTFTVTNTGNVQLTDVTVTDDLEGLGPITCPADRLFPTDEPMVCTATYVVAQGDIDAGGIVNVASVTGTPPSGPPLEEPSNEVVIDGPERRAELTLVKSAHHHDRDGDGRVAAGEQITYSFLVTNVGNVTLTDVAVEDPMPGLSTPTCPQPDLLPAEAMTCTATYVVTTADEQAGRIVNTATATADGPADVLSRAQSAPSTATTEVEGAAPTQSGVLPRTGSALADLVLAAIALLLTGRVLTRRRGAVVRPLT